MVDLEQLAQQVIGGRADETGRLVKQALDEGMDAQTVLERGLIAGMAVIGMRFRANEIFVPEVLVAARAMKAGLELLEPVFAASGVQPLGTVVLGTVKGDIHDIGKNLVGMMLRGAGFRVIDLGVNVPQPKLLEAVAQHSPEIVALSALLTTTMGQMPLNIRALREAGYAGKIMVGGAPLSQEFAEKAGADAYGANAPDAVEQALRLIGAAA